jgi:hypothetical protein
MATEEKAGKKKKGGGDIGGILAFEAIRDSLELAMVQISMRFRLIFPTFPS